VIVLDGAGPPTPEEKPMSEPTRWAGVAAAAATIAVMAAGCGSSSSGLASKTPSQIVAAAESAIKGATSYEISGSGTTSTGVTSFDLKVVGADISGSFVLNGVTIAMVEVASNIYIKAPASFYTAKGASAAGAELLGGVWVEITAGSSYASNFSSLSNITDIPSKLSSTTATFTSDGTGTVDGQSVVFLKDTTSGDIVAIATSGPAYPLQLKETGSTPGTYDVSNWNSVATFTAPPNPVKLPSA
jgi:hypothetical protein